jgi:hypothetical protein
MTHRIHIHLHGRDGAVTTHDWDPSEHPRGGRGQFGIGKGKPFQQGEHPRGEGGSFVPGSHPGQRSERQKRERKDLVGNKDD